uniref:Endonuclease/exonuclease/phosphatase domain-containing protein n=1 Tax=Latimeria chalumnae TaxID=7897 RepID=H3AE13_LATCH
VCILIGRRVLFIEKETIIDQEGRYVIVRGMLLGEEVVLASVYAPNIVPIIKLLSECMLSGGGGDWNRVWDAEVDRSGGPLPFDNKTSRAIRTLARDIGLIDIWRQVHEHDQEFSHMSRAHKSYSRIDMILVLQAVALATIDAQIETCILSDHAPVSLKLPSPKLIKTLSWQLNTALLRDAFSQKAIENEITTFFENNDGTASTSLILWDSFKASLKGWLISFSTARKKQFQKEWVTIEKEVQKLEKTHTVNPKDEVLYGQLLEEKQKLQQLVNSKTEFSLFGSRKNFFESGDKAGCLLVYKLKKQEIVAMIQTIRDSSGGLTFDPKQINDTFKAFYETLYKAEVEVSDEALEEFLDGVELPTLGEEASELLLASISEQEV